MTTAKKDTDGKPSLVDLFDLPSDAPSSVWSEPEDAPYAAEDQASSSFHAPTAATATTGEVVEAAATGAAPKLRLPAWLFIASGVLGAALVVVLTISYSHRGAPAKTEESAAAPTLPADATPRDATVHEASPHEEATAAPAIAARAPAVPTDHSALVAARAALRAAEADLSAGRRAAARARMGRLLLAIDAVEPRERDGIHAAAALLVARSLQADADSARDSRADTNVTRRASH